MNWFSKKTAARSSGKVLLLIDWDNLFHGLQARFGFQNMDLESRIKKLMSWVSSEVGTVLDGYGFVFAPEHLLPNHQDLCTNNNLRLITCPKKNTPDTKPEDTVDETIMWFGSLMLRHPEVQFLCLVSGDEDYEPLLKKAKKSGVKIALVTPVLRSLTNEGGLVKFANIHPLTRKQMFVTLDAL